MDHVQYETVLYFSLLQSQNQFVQQLGGGAPLEETALSRGVVSKQPQLTVLEIALPGFFLDRLYQIP